MQHNSAELENELLLTLILASPFRLSDAKPVVNRTRSTSKPRIHPTILELENRNGFKIQVSKHVNTMSCYIKELHRRPKLVFPVVMFAQPPINRLDTTRRSPLNAFNPILARNCHDCFFRCDSAFPLLCGTVDIRGNFKRYFELFTLAE